MDTPRSHFADRFLCDSGHGHRRRRHIPARRSSDWWRFRMWRLLMPWPIRTSPYGADSASLRWQQGARKAPRRAGGGSGSGTGASGLPGPGTNFFIAHLPPRPPAPRGMTDDCAWAAAACRTYHTAAGSWQLAVARRKAAGRRAWQMANGRWQMAALPVHWHWHTGIIGYRRLSPCFRHAHVYVKVKNCSPKYGWHVSAAPVLSGCSSSRKRSVDGLQGCRSRKFQV
jgi:hypothetical protein